MSLYQVQKLIYQLNRDPETRRRFSADSQELLAGYELTAEELAAINRPDIGLLYVMGVNGQLLMHYAAMCGFEWDAYIAAMRAGLQQYGPVRTGLYVAAREPT
ncbi:MAG TPA: hypothetical protein VGO41_06605 [Steroidobacteraceae bacterium]|nr:hypothetical protein [Steroidobacteraceae bacterium]